jgi:N-acetyl-beta-hexosaminidase
MAPAPLLHASPKPKFAKPQVASRELIQDFGSLSVGASWPEQQRQATTVLVPSPEQFASRNSATTLSNAPVSIEEAHQALAIVLQFLEQNRLLHEPSNKILNEDELSTMRSLAENIGHERLHAREDGRSRR